MQNISLHIEYLLRSHDCVILPGIGAFLRTRRPAVCDNDGKLLPPCVQICFNSSIVSSDGLLCHSVARRARISHEQAAVVVSNASEECRNALAKNGEFAVGKLGRLVQDEEQCISFRPYRSLYDNVWKSISPIPSRKEEAETSAKIIAPSVADKNDDKYYIIKISRQAVRYAAMATICLLTAATLLLPSATRTGSDSMIMTKQYASVVPGVENVASSTSEPAQTTKANSENVQKVAAQDVVQDNFDTPEVLNESTFYLIVATFKKEEDCQKYISTQPDADKLEVITNGKVSRVYSSCSDNREELLSELNSPEHRNLHPQAWIWEKP